MQYDFSDDEVNAFGVLIDEALKATGIKFAITAGVLLSKLRAPYQSQNGGPDLVHSAAPVANDADIPAGTPVADTAQAA